MSRSIIYIHNVSSISVLFVNVFKKITYSFFYKKLNIISTDYLDFEKYFLNFIEKYSFMIL